MSELIELKLDNLSEEQSAHILDYITRVLLPIETDDYDESHDGIIQDSTVANQQIDDELL